MVGVLTDDCLGGPLEAVDDGEITGEREHSAPALDVRHNPALTQSFLEALGADFGLERAAHEN